MRSVEIRYQNLMQLLTKYKKVSEFCEKIGISASYFSQIKTKRKNIGDMMARKIEIELGLKKGFLDSLPVEIKNPNEGILHPSILSLAYAIESIEPEVREHLKKLVFQMAISLSKLENKSFAE